MRFRRAGTLEPAHQHELNPVHSAQVRSHLRLTGCKVGLLINFNVRHLVDGLERIVNEFPDD
jgi:GxxExxY protein